MKRKIINRIMFGIPVGICIGLVITICISLLIGDGNFYPCSDLLITKLGNEINGFIVQLLLCALIGGAFSASSVFWENDWSIVKQTAAYFLVTCSVMMTVAYVLEWMHHSILGFLIYFGIFILIFVFMCLIQMIVYKFKINQINNKLKSGGNY